MRKFTTIYLLPVSLLLYLFLTSNSGGRASAAGQDNTGAPGSGGTCGNCHGGGSYGTVTLTIQVFQAGTLTPVTSYVGGTTYDMRVTVNNSAGSPAGYGFQMICLTTPGNTPVSLPYTNLASNVKQILFTSGGLNGKRYVEHQGVTNNNTFNFSWTAPAAGTGSVRFFASGNAVNGGGSSGDNAGATTLTLAEQAVLTASGTVTSVSCFGGNNGAINITASGGTSPYSYNWGGGITTEDRSNLSPGTYSVTVTDAASATASASFTVTQPSAALSGTGTITNVSCNGGNNGVINLTVQGGTSPYTYNWGGGITTEDRSGLTANTYTVTITDSKSCTATATFNITQPAQSLSVTGNVTNIPCHNGSNGAIDVSISGGTSPYTYSWADGPTTQDRNQLVAGSYPVTVTDNNSCTASAIFNVLQPGQPLSINGSVINVLCFGLNTGSINITALGGTSPYLYNWGNGITTEDRSTLTAGTYTVTVTDNQSCTSTATYNLTQPQQFLIDAVPNAISCFGGTATVTISATGGVTPYTGTGTFTQSAGTVNYTVSDANQCSANVNVTMVQPPLLVADATDISIPCTGGSGTITVSAIGGVTPYSGTGNFTVTTPGQQTYTVTDANGCTANAVSNVSSTSGFTTQDSITNLKCFGVCQGAVSVSVSGGTPPYNYSWSNGATSASISGVCAATYTQTITDNANCTLVNTYQVTTPTALNATLAADTAACFGDPMQVTVAPSGGVSPYTYSWNNGSATTSVLFNAGTASVTVTDANNCVKTQTVVLTQPDSILLQVVNVSSDNGSGSGEIDITASGGVPPYTYLWTNGITTQDLSAIPQGVYGVTVIDNNGCVKSLGNISVLSTDIEQLQPSSVTFYPNPFSSALTIQSDKAGLLRIYDVSGQLIWSFEINEGLNRLEVTSVQRGTYFAEFRSDSEVRQWKMIKAE